MGGDGALCLYVELDDGQSVGALASVKHHHANWPAAATLLKSGVLRIWARDKGLEGSEAYWEHGEPL